MLLEPPVNVVACVKFKSFWRFFFCFLFPTELQNLSKRAHIHTTLSRRWVILAAPSPVSCGGGLFTQSYTFSLLQLHTHTVVNPQLPIFPATHRVGVEEKKRTNTARARVILFPRATPNSPACYCVWESLSVCERCSCQDLVLLVWVCACVLFTPEPFFHLNRVFFFSHSLDFRFFTFNFFFSSCVFSASISNLTSWPNSMAYCGLFERTSRNRNAPVFLKLLKKKPKL